MGLFFRNSKPSRDPLVPAAETPARKLKLEYVVLNGSSAWEKESPASLAAAFNNWLEKYRGLAPADQDRELQGYAKSAEDKLRQLEK